MTVQHWVSKLMDITPITTLKTYIFIMMINGHNTYNYTISSLRLLMDITTIIKLKTYIFIMKNDGHNTCH